MPTGEQGEQQAANAAVSAPGSGHSVIAWLARHWAGLLSAVALFLIFSGFLLLKCFSLHPAYSDEGIYFYMAKATAERGLTPYRDYFLCHPPLQLVPLVLMWKLSGGHWLALKPIPWVASMLSAWMLYLMAARCWGRLEGVLASGLFLSSYLVLITSSYGTGVSETTALALVGLYLLLQRRDLFAGMALGLATQTGTYALPAVVTAIALIFLGSLPWRHRLPDLRSMLWRALRPLKRLALGFILVWGPVTVLMLALAGLEFPGQVWAYRMQTPSGMIGLGLGGGLAYTVLAHPYLFWAAILALVSFAIEWWQSAYSTSSSAPARSRQRRGRSQPLPTTPSPEPGFGFWSSLWIRPRYQLVALALLLLLAVLCSLSGLHGNVLDYYLVLLLPPMALLASFAFGAWWRAAMGWAVPSLRGQSAWRRRSEVTVMLGLVLLVTYSPAQGWLIAKLGLAADAQGAPQYFTWFDAPVPATVNDLVRKLFWEEAGYGLLNGNPVREYLWSESMNRYRFADTAAAFIRRHARPDETIFGDMDIAPMLALLCDRRLAADIADTSSVRFAIGLLPLQNCWRRVARDRLAYVVFDSPGDLVSVPGMEALIQRDCVLAASYPAGGMVGDLYIYELRARASEGGPPAGR